jgi:uncharacterized protein
VSSATYNPADYLDLYDFRMRVIQMYRERNQSEGREDPQIVWERFRAKRDELFIRHPQSALTPREKEKFSGLDYYPYNPSARVEATLDPNVEPRELRVGTSGGTTVLVRRVALATFALQGEEVALTVYWIDVYGGGLFLPFRDATSSGETYGGGRYLFDTIKGSDCALARSDLRAQLDFNYAYNPSCAYNPEWVCPLAPPENRLRVRVEAGEKRFRALGN